MCTFFDWRQFTAINSLTGFPFATNFPQWCDIMFLESCRL
jgi:hypothetical protein